ncbi:hypothetical protein IFR04_014407 [Cadophora malorum]|uniref:Uncharacterized protein n=1 Tax=Cadophora malorum TaxID=108018 RepID=A0A8H7T553_9HELO|nr:hypothetical protein IFR04_014407 [Cadophora malorum]
MMLRKAFQVQREMNLLDRCLYIQLAQLFPAATYSAAVLTFNKIILVAWIFSNTSTLLSQNTFEFADLQWRKYDDGRFPGLYIVDGGLDAFYDKFFVQTLNLATLFSISHAPSSLLALYPLVPFLQHAPKNFAATFEDALLRVKRAIESLDWTIRRGYIFRIDHQNPRFQVTECRAVQISDGSK